MGSGEPGGYQKKALDTCLRGYICCYWPCTSRSLLGPLQLLDLMGTFPGPLSLELSHCSSVRFTVSSGFSEPLSSTQLLICASGFKALKTVWIWSKLFQKGFDILPLVLYATGKWHWCFRLGSKQCCLFFPQGRRIRHSVFLSFMFSS